MAITSLMLKKVESKEKRYVIKDEKGLYLEVMPTGNKFWRLRYWVDSKEYKISLGVYPEVGLADVRKKRDELRGEIARGINPLLEKKEKKQLELNQSKHQFEAVAREWVEKFSNKWSPNHTELTLRRLEANIFPYLGTRPIAQITPTELLNILRKIEKRGALEVAKRTRGICSMIFRYAIASGIAERDPARDLQGALTPPPKKHFGTITDPKKVGQLLRDIENCDAHFTIYVAIQLAPLLFVRPGELRHAEWNEFDLEAKEWRIPAEKTKMKTTHIVPLAEQAIVYLKNIHELTGDGKYVFPSLRTKVRPISENT